MVNRLSTWTVLFNSKSPFKFIDKIIVTSVHGRLPSFYIHRWGYSDQVWNNISPKGLSTLLNKNCNFNRLSWPLTGKFKIKNALIRQSISICILIGRLRFSSSGFAHHLFNQKIFFIKIYAKLLYTGWFIQIYPFIGNIHKPRGQNFGYFWPPFVVTFTK